MAREIFTYIGYSPVNCNYSNNYFSSIRHLSQDRWQKFKTLNRSKNAKRCTSTLDVLPPCFQ
jgi:hypothetical protein